jgi:hypothetical protein
MDRLAEEHLKGKRISEVYKTHLLAVSQTAMRVQLYEMTRFDLAKRGVHTYVAEAWSAFF